MHTRFPGIVLGKTEYVVNAPPDGYTILLVTQSNSINATLYSNLNFNFMRDIVPTYSIDLDT